jgi:ribose transport system substrate-binding protein
MFLRRIRRRLWLPALLVALALISAACGTDEGADAPEDGTAAAAGGTVDEATTGGAGGVIGVSVADQKSLFYVSAVDGMRHAAQEAGYELRVLSANNNANVQVNQVQDLITQQVGALIYTPQDATAAAAGVRAANQADIPVIGVDQRPEGDDATLATYIATDSVAAARELCTWLFDEMGGSGQLAILQGVLGSTAEIQRTQGCNEALEEYPDVEVVAMTSANWDETEAFRATENILTANPELDAVFGESDAMAMGAAKAAQQAGRHDGMMFVGIDGFPTMFEEIENGLVHATMAQQPYAMGQEAVRDAIRLMEGDGDIPELQWKETELVHQGNVGDFSPEDFYGPMGAPDAVLPDDAEGEVEGVEPEDDDAQAADE